MIAPVFGATFGPIDDHEPLRWMGRDSRLGWTEIPGVLLNDTEVGALGADGRFRPVYYTVRAIQAAAFGDHVTWWYVSVLIAFAITCGVTGYVFARWVVAAAKLYEPHQERLVLVVTSIVGSVLVLTLPAWQGIVVRLGPSEQVGMVAVAVTALGLTELGLGSGRGWWWIVAGGSAVAVMSKENLLGVGIVVTTLACSGWRTDSERRRLAVCAGAPVVAMGLVMLRIGMSGEDVYRRPTGPSRLDGVVDSLATPLVRQWAWTLGLLLVAAACYTVVVGTHRWLLFTIAGITLVVVVDLAITGGDYGQARYRILIQYVALAQVVGAAVLFLAGLRRSSRRTLGSLAGVTVGLLAWVWVSAMSSNLEQLNHAADWNRRMTVRFDTAISETVEAVNGGSDFAVIDVSADSYELTLSIVSEVWRRADIPTLGFVLTSSDTMRTSSLDDQLGQTLSELSWSGDDEQHIRPAGELSGRPMWCVLPIPDPEPVSVCAATSVAGPSYLR